MIVAKDNPSLRVKIRLIHSLANLIYWAKVGYYNGHYSLGNFSIADENYDNLEEILKKLLPEHPILHIVGCPNYKQMETILLSSDEIYRLIEEIQK